MIFPRVSWTVLVLLWALPQWGWCGDLGGIGVLGDSYCDEYQFGAPAVRTARNWIEILAATRGLDFGRISTESRGEPRNEGFEYNWARRDASTVDLIAQGQHTGLAEQVASGQVRFVWIFVGGNDFINALKSPDPKAALKAQLPRILAHYRKAVETILAADPEVKLGLGTIPDLRYLPEFAGLIQEGRISQDLADTYSAGIGRYNTQVRLFAAQNPNRVMLIELALSTKLADRLQVDEATIAGRKVDRKKAGTSLDCFFLPDGRHPGTLGQGLMAQFFIRTVNARFGAGIEPLSDRELLDFAESLQDSPEGPGQAKVDPRNDP